jgi:hypothetical protein
MRKETRGSDVAAVVLLSLNWLLILILWGVNAFPPKKIPAPDAELSRVTGDIQRMGGADFTESRSPASGAVMVHQTDLERARIWG